VFIIFKKITFAFKDLLNVGYLGLSATEVVRPSGYLKTVCSFPLIFILYHVRFKITNLFKTVFRASIAYFGTSSRNSRACRRVSSKYFRVPPDDGIESDYLKQILA
jgi:hypothetical protein